MRENIRTANPNAVIIHAASPISVDDADPEAIRGKRVLCVEDGPTLTHGDMSFGAGVVLAKIRRGRDHRSASLRRRFDQGNV